MNARLPLLFALAAALALPHSASASQRGPAPEPATPPAAAPTSDTPPTTSPTDEELDLTAEREAAAARRTADPSPANWRAEGQLAERAGDWGGASDAYEQALSRMDPQDPMRAAVQEDLARVHERERGVVADEGKSTHRDELDRTWKQPEPTKTTRAPTQQLPAQAPKDDRIVKKWYFWVTIGAIVASAAAVTGIAIKAARDDKPDALDRRAVFGIGTGALRF